MNKLKTLEIKYATREEREVVWVSPATKKLIGKLKGDQSYGKFITILVNNYVIATNEAKNVGRV